MPKTVGSILHGAYGDYYWQATCLKLLAQRNPAVRIRLYGAAPARMEALRQFDLSFADSFEPWQALLGGPAPDEFLQYQVQDPDLTRDVLGQLPPEILARLDRQRNRVFYRDLRPHWPLGPKDRLRLSPAGLQETERVMRACGLGPDFFARRPTLAFLWRYRRSTSAISPLLQPPEEECVRKYSEAFGRLIENYDCHVLATGMKLVTDDTNRKRVDAKFATYGLDLPPERCTYLKGLGWAADLEILSRCTVAAGMASGFSEALDAHRGGGVLLLDPPIVYALKMLKYRIRLFGHMEARGSWWIWSRHHTADRIYQRLAADLEAASARRSR